MLDCTGYPYRNVEFRRHNFPGLSYLKIVVDKPGIHGGSGGADGSSQQVRKLLNDLEVFG